MEGLKSLFATSVPHRIAFTAIAACLVVVGLGASAAPSSASSRISSSANARYQVRVSKARYQVRVSIAIAMTWSANKHWTSGHGCNSDTIEGSGNLNWHATGNWGLSESAYRYRGTPYIFGVPTGPNGKGSPRVNVTQSDMGDATFTQTPVCPGAVGYTVNADTSGCGTEHKTGAPFQTDFYAHSNRPGVPNTKPTASTMWGVEGLLIPYDPAYLPDFAFAKAACPFAWWRELKTGPRPGNQPVVRGNPEGVTVTGSSQATWPALRAKKRFMEEHWVETVQWPAITSLGGSEADPAPKVGGATATEKLDVLYCLKSAGGCGSRMP